MVSYAKRGHNYSYSRRFGKKQGKKHVLLEHLPDGLLTVSIYKTLCGLELAGIYRTDKDKIDCLKCAKLIDPKRQGIIDMGLLGTLGLDNVPDGVTPGKYHAYLFECKVQGKKDDPSKKFVVFTYKISDNAMNPSEFHNDKSSKEWRSCNADDTINQKRMLKQRFLQLGVPESRLGDDNFDIADLAGTEIYLTVTKSGQYTNYSCELVNPADAASNAYVAPESASKPVTATTAADLL